MEIDNGNAFDFGLAAEDYAKYRDIYPVEFYNKIYELGFYRNKRFWIWEREQAFCQELCINTVQI